MEQLNFKSFHLSQEILKALKKLEYKKPSEVQEKVIPLALKGKDIIVKSETGSGKTAAFAIPICERIELERKEPQALVLTPTRELAVQIKDDISNIGIFKRIRCAVVFGKQPMSIQVRELKQRIHIVVGTPGRILDHINRQNVNLTKIKYLIIDEADEMLNMGFIEQVKAVVEALPNNRITMLFSATMPEAIEKLCSKYMNDPIKIEVNPEKLTTENIKQFYYEVEEDEKFSLLNNIIYTERPQSCILFCSMKERVDNLLKKMQSKGYSCNALHGGMEQKDRLDTMENFKRGEFRFLIATDVAARGIHIEDITHVINYDVPLEKESYIHRIGRTGRAGNKGIAITFVSSREIKFFKIVEDYIGYKIPKGEIPSEDMIQKGKIIFQKESKVKLKPKVDNKNKLSEDITKLYISAGKKKKIRPGDIVGTIISIEGININDIGIIDIQDNISYVDILNKKGNIVLKGLQTKTIKGKKVRIERAIK
ncbi:superfamily II DNA/RNA helicase [Clostridium tetanomorphum]|uniref:ATP-dependent RNA helicase DbpA n=1 Tax=Clostridium tetanomorphum TaxID=1553 RepID=A0A923E5S6_CLOTT|nr:DEAD/DEAH box helicase [Clostridium tetanomorphum]KAJ50134.1 ATP-dependent RNA helicase DbpA [Clostridium tetanomorphum DSM 665]MBC2396960.1 DEAD/DEAH box helicase [Clostridium tetanomorphum]MBP1862879.1 superfamily II DNA/RNA helicase [Clostridium tetanomorphum]NRS87016.1 superfamily II DNA/RNA helicase [Clostridium tetanomorphum]NRZ99198.1 superfamily II DNA/RNA helicase [Clostridium tetanomorphum]